MELMSADFDIFQVKEDVFIRNVGLVRHFEVTTIDGKRFFCVLTDTECVLFALDKINVDERKRSNVLRQGTSNSYFGCLGLVATSEVAQLNERKLRPSVYRFDLVNVHSISARKTHPKFASSVTPTVNITAASMAHCLQGPGTNFELHIELEQADLENFDGTGKVQGRSRGQGSSIVLVPQGCDGAAALAVALLALREQSTLLRAAGYPADVLRASAEGPARQFLATALLELEARDGDHDMFAEQCALLKEVIPFDRLKIAFSFGKKINSPTFPLKFKN
jgi:hypothetical protein